MSQLFGKEVGKLNFVTSMWHRPGNFVQSIHQSDCAEYLFSLMILYNSVVRLIQSTEAQKYVEGKYFHGKWTFQV